MKGLNKHFLFQHFPWRERKWRVLTYTGYSLALVGGALALAGVPVVAGLFLQGPLWALGLVAAGTCLGYLGQKKERESPGGGRVGGKRVAMPKENRGPFPAPRAPGPKVVAIGGGTGLSVLLRGLKEHPCDITAIVTVADDGGSSGQLRGQLGMLPPGDIRSCLLALAQVEPALGEVFQYRFTQGEGLKGHNLGNLFMAALTEQVGFKEAVAQFSRMLSVRGKVYPVTLDNLELLAELEDGKIIKGESRLVACGKPIRKIFLSPRDCRPLPEVLESIKKADAIIMGPGSLYTSVIPNLLVPGVAQAIRSARGAKFYVCNVMTQAGETEGYSLSRHLRALEDHGGKGLVDYLVVNIDTDIPGGLKERYLEENAEPVKFDLKNLKAFPGIIIADRLMSKNDYLRHDGSRLASLLMERLLEGKKAGLKKGMDIQGQLGQDRGKHYVL